MKRVLFLIVNLLSLTSCNGKIDIRQESSKFQVIVLANNSRTYIKGIECRFVFNINKNDRKKIFISNPCHYIDKYHSESQYSSAMRIEVEKAGVPILLESNDDKRFISKHSELYIVYTVHRLDSSYISQQSLMKYLEQMILKKKDTLHVGTISEFKNNNPDLLENLLKGDSIVFDFYYHCWALIPS